MSPLKNFTHCVVPLFAHPKDFFDYISKSTKLSFAVSFGGITQRESRYQKAILTIGSPVTTDFDALSEVKKFVNTYDKKGIMQDTNQLVDLLIQKRPIAAHRIANFKR